MLPVTKFQVLAIISVVNRGLTVAGALALLLHMLQELEQIGEMRGT